MTSRKRNDVDVLPAIERAGALNPTKTAKVSYTLTRGSKSVQATTEKFCIYCDEFNDPEYYDPAFPRGGGYCGNWNGAVGFDDSCIHWKHPTHACSWLVKAYMQSSSNNYPASPWHQLFDL